MGPLTALFPPGKGGGSGVEYGFKGKGVLIHTLVDGNGSPLAVSVTPANGDERVEALELIAGLSVKSGSVGRPKKSPKIVAADKGYDSQFISGDYRRLWRGRRRFRWPSRSRGHSR